MSNRVAGAKRLLFRCRDCGELNAVEWTGPPAAPQREMGPRGSWWFGACLWACAVLWLLLGGLGLALGLILWLR